MPRYQRIHVIINPASGGNEPVLNTLNDVWQPHDIDWSVSVTHGPDDARDQARAARERGVDLVAAYGGDGTLLSAAVGLLDSDVPLGVLPGGTANALADEMNVPPSLPDAAKLLCADDNRTRAMDVGRAGERYFLLRVGTGMIATFSESATRDLKDRFGIAAYIISGVQALSQPHNVTYTLTIDGRSFDIEGIACLITNANAIGALNIRLSQHIDSGDGLLDVFVLQADLQTVAGMAGSILQINNLPFELQHWQCRQVTISAEPSQGIYGDGEEVPFTHTPTTVHLLPGALDVVVPGV
jgi:YegS/Rv2252/BmrU family lipid kinase